MNLKPEQIALVQSWADAFADLNTIQKNLAEQCDLHLTYMDTRFLLLDLNIQLQSPAPPVKAKEETTKEANIPAQKDIQITVDQVLAPGALLSGKVTFASGASGSWFLDQTGRLSWEPIMGEPTTEDLEVFQQELPKVIKSQLGAV